jgi:hypothetical protein
MNRPTGLKAKAEGKRGDTNYAPLLGGAEVIGEDGKNPHDSSTAAHFYEGNTPTRFQHVPTTLVAGFQTFFAAKQPYQSKGSLFSDALFSAAKQPYVLKGSGAQRRHGNGEALGQYQG